MATRQRRTQPVATPAPRRHVLRLLALGATAVALLWSGQDVTWLLPGRAGTLWLLERAAVVTSLAAILLLLTRSWVFWAIIVSTVIVGLCS